MKLDEVLSALELSSDAELGRMLHLTRGAIWHWRRDEQIPASRRLELAAMIRARGKAVPDWLLEPPNARHPKAA